jgi:uncharacterized membrane-anchored protein
MKTPRIFSFSNFLLFILILTFTSTVNAANTLNFKSDTLQKEQEAFDKAFNVSIPGPAKIPLKDQATLNLADDYFYIPPKEAAALLQSMGNETGPEFAGLVIPKDHVHWFITIDYIKSGYIKDADARKWNSNDLLEKIKKSTALENQARAAQALSPLSIAGWIEPPIYNSTLHQLIWSALGKVPGSDVDSNHETVNYNTYLLGREGYFNLSLITSNASINDDKIHAKNILTAISYNQGKRYEDYDKHSDLTAQYGLSSLITGLVMKHPSFFTNAAIFVLNDWQLLALCILLLILSTRYHFRRLARSTILNTE